MWTALYLHVCYSICEAKLLFKCSISHFGQEANVGSTCVVNFVGFILIIPTFLAILYRKATKFCINDSSSWIPNFIGFLWKMAEKQVHLINSVGKCPYLVTYNTLWHIHGVQLYTYMYMYMPRVLNSKTRD